MVLQFMRMLLTGLRHFMAFILMLITAVIMTSESAYAQNITRIYEAHPPSRAPHGNSNPICSDVFATDPKMQIVETTLRQGPQGSEPTQVRTESDTRSAKIDPVVDRVLKDWTQDRDYTPEQASMLQQRDQQLDPRRTTYISFEAEGHVAIVRIFDGSHNVLKGGTEWPAASETSSLTPIEIGRPGYKLPERIWQEQYGRPSYMWELGLVDVNREIKNGVETIFSGVAKKLDLHYNNHDFELLSDLKTITSRQMIIYAQTRANRLNIFKKYGFQPTLVADRNGEIKPFEVAPNLVLISMKAEDFLKRFYSPKLFAEAKKQESQYNQTETEINQKKIQEYIRKIDSRRIHLTNQHDISQEALKVFKTYVQLRMTPGRSDLRKNMAIDFFESYLTMLNSIPTQYRHKNWVNLRNLTIEVMGYPSPFDALYYFSNSMDNVGKGRKFELSNADQERFLNSPPPRRFDLLFPTEPTLNLNFQY